MKINMPGCYIQEKGAMSTIFKYNKFMHGEKVAFGTIVQMILENKDAHLIDKVKELYKMIDLPYNVKQIGMEDEEELCQIAKRACEKDQPIHRMKKVFAHEDKIKSAIKFTENL